MTNSGFLKFPFILEKKIRFFKVNLHKHYLFFEICFWVASLLEGLVCSQQRPKGAAKPLAISQFLFLLFAALRLALARWGRGRQLDALLKIFHKSFHQQVGQFFPQLFQLLFQQVFRLLLLQVFLQFFLLICDDFPKYIAKSLTNKRSLRRSNFPLCQDLFLFFQFPFLVFITTVREMSMSFKFTSRSSSSVNKK